MRKHRPWCVVNEVGLIISRRETEESARECAERSDASMRRLGVKTAKCRVIYRPTQVAQLRQGDP